MKLNKALELALTTRVMEDVIRGDDGFFVYWPERTKRQGYLDAHLLRFIADILDKMNEPLITDLDNHFASERKQLTLDLEAFATGDKNAITESP